VPPLSLITSLIFANVLSLLSVSHSTITATLFGKMPSTVNLSKLTPVKLLPWPRAMAASIEAFAKPSFLAFVTKSASFGFALTSGPNSLEAVAISWAKMERWRFL